MEGCFSVCTIHYAYSSAINYVRPEKGETFVLCSLQKGTSPILKTRGLMEVLSFGSRYVIRSLW